MANSEMSADDLPLSVEQKNHLQNQVLEITFLDDHYKLRGYSCCSCKNVAISHCIAGCRDVFCNLCYLKHFMQPCPVCKLTVEKNTQDLAFERVVLELKVECKFKKNGCRDVINLKNFLAHASRCNFTHQKLLPKSNIDDSTGGAIKQLTDDVAYIKKAMESMQMEITKLTEATKDIQAQHRGAMPSQLQTYNFGNELPTYEQLQADANGSTTVLWKVSGFQKKLLGLMETDPVKVSSEECFSTPSGLKFRPVLSRSTAGEYIHIQLEFADYSSAAHDDSSMPYLHSRKYILLDQSTAMEKENVELIDQPMFRLNTAKVMMAPRFRHSTFIFVSLLNGENKYVKFDQILIKIILEPIALLWKEIVSNEGNVLLRLVDYSKKKQDAVTGLKLCLTSKPFKTDHMGYTMVVNAYLNGQGESKGNCISLYITFILGEQDASLPLPFKCQLKFCLLDQSDSSKKENIIKVTDAEFNQSVLNFGYHKFVSHSKAEKSKYLRNDCLLMQIKVLIQ